MALVTERQEQYAVSVTDVLSFLQYSNRLQGILEKTDFNTISILCQVLRECWSNDQRVFLCGNGGSAGNAMHIANDLLFGVNPQGQGIQVEALSANSSVVSCLANDLGFEHVYSQQLETQGHKGDILIALSGSGNSANIINALRTAREKGMYSCAILGFDGGLCKSLADLVIHFNIDDMQISEDMQLVVGHMVMKALRG